MSDESDVNASAEAETSMDPSLDGWMTAPGYTIAATPDLPGVMKQANAVTAEPINIVAAGVDDHGQHYSTVAWRHRGARSQWTGPREEIYGNALLSLAGRGAPVHSGNRGAVQTFLQAQESANEALIPTERIFRPGWSKDFDAYVLGERVIGRADGRAAPGDDQRLIEALQPRGNLDAYRALCVRAREASPVAEMAWAAGYTAPLIQLLGMRSTVLSLWGPSGSGKSAVQALAVSAWGRPKGIKLTADISSAALEIALANRNDFILWVDDTQQATTEEFLESLAYRVGNDTSAARAVQSGGSRKVRVWSSQVFVSGERPMHSRGAAAGAQNRSIEIQAAPLDKALASALHSGLDEHHGYTGPLFIEALLREFIRPGKLNELRDTYREAQALLDPAKNEASSQVALLVVADLLARVHVWGEDRDAAGAAAVKCGREVLRLVQAEKRDVGTPFEDQYDNLNSYVAANVASFEGRHTSMDRVRLLGRLPPGEEGGRHVVDLLPTALKEFAKTHEYNERQFLAALKERGFLLPGDGANATRKVQFKGSRVRCYSIVLDSENVGARS